MNENRTTICEQCNKTVPMNTIRYVAKGKDTVMAVCSECRSQESGTKSAIIKNIVAKTNAPKPAVFEKPVTVAKPAPVSHKRIYFCRSCRYKFKVDPSKGTHIKCPYCGLSDDVEEYEVQSTDTLVRSSSQEL